MDRLDQKEFTMRAGMYYVWNYEKQQARWQRKSQHIGVLKTGYVFDIVVGHKTVRRCIEVKGQSNKNPVAFRIHRSALHRHPITNEVPIRSKKYYVYLVYNIGLNKSPYLIIMDSEFLRKHKHIGRDGQIHILDVNDSIQREKIKPITLSKLTGDKKKMVLKFWKRFRQNCSPDSSGLWTKVG